MTVTLEKIVHQDQESEQLPSEAYSNLPGTKITIKLKDENSDGVAPAVIAVFIVVVSYFTSIAQPLPAPDSPPEVAPAEYQIRRISAAHMTSGTVVLESWKPWDN